MVGGAAANDIDAAHIFDGFFIQAQLAQINAAILDAGAEGIPHSGGLFVDLLHHKVLVTAFFGGFGIPLDGAGFFSTGSLSMLKNSILSGVRRAISRLSM